MSETKNVVIDDQNEAAASEQQVNNRRRDINRLTKETNYQLFSALTQAMEEVQGNRKTGDAICDSEMYCDMWALQSAAFARVVKHDRKLQQYEDMETGELLHQLYQRLHHYGACKGRPLPGIAWTESGGRFVIQLRDCAINMEHTITDEARLPGWNGTISELSGTLYAIGYDHDIDCESGELEGHYEEALNFLCCLNTDDPDATEHRDVIIYHRSWQHREVLRDTLASLDMIADIANENNNKNV